MHTLELIFFVIIYPRFAIYAKHKAEKVEHLLEHVCNATNQVANKVFMSHAPNVLDYFVKKLETTWIMSNIADIVNTIISEL